MNNLAKQTFTSLLIIAAAAAFNGCKTNNEPTYTSTASTTSAAPVATTTQSTAPSTPAPAAMAAPAAPAAPPAVTATSSGAHPAPPVRIKAGPSDSFKDADGNTWIPETGIADGDSIERPDIQIANTKTPKIYQSEHYSMTSFSYQVPNGKYTVKLHFCETFEGITGPGERVFSFSVEGHPYKDFDVWVKAGGAMKAYIETVNDVQVNDGKLDITFEPKVENPQINGIEILPAS